jgi:hypothetical protein
MAPYSRWPADARFLSCVHSVVIGGFRDGKGYLGASTMLGISYEENFLVRGISGPAWRRTLALHTSRLLPWWPRRLAPHKSRFLPC